MVQDLHSTHESQPQGRRANWPAAHSDLRVPSHRASAAVPQLADGNRRSSRPAIVEWKNPRQTQSASSPKPHSMRLARRTAIVSTALRAALGTIQQDLHPTPDVVLRASEPYCGG